MSTRTVQCLYCGKRIDPTAPRCPHCGQDQVIHTPRIRCNNCGRRVPASLVVCPRCGKDPRGFYLKAWHIVVAFLLAVSGVFAWFFVGSGGPGEVPRAAAAATPTPKPSNTRAPVRIVVTATPQPPTATRVSPSPEPTKSATPLPSATPEPTATSTPLRPTRVPARPTETATNTPVPTVSAPLLVSPKDGERVSGARRNVELVFEPTHQLGDNEWHRVQVDFLDRSGNPISWCGWTKGTSLGFPSEYFDDSSPISRKFLWRVSVVRAVDQHPSTCQAQFESLNAQSALWSFYWY